MTRLRITLPGGAVQRIPLGTAPKTIGRFGDADIVVEDSQVSRKHCSVAALPDGVRVDDHGSTNGTFVNGQRIRTAVLKDGDQFQVSEVFFTVECDVPAGFSTTVRKVEEQFASGKGFNTVAMEISAVSGKKPPSKP